MLFFRRLLWTRQRFRGKKCVLRQHEGVKGRCGRCCPRFTGGSRTTPEVLRSMKYKWRGNEAKHGVRERSSEEHRSSSGSCEVVQHEQEALRNLNYMFVQPSLVSHLSE